MSSFTENKNSTNDDVFSSANSTAVIWNTYYHLVMVDFSLAESTAFQSTLAIPFQVLRKFNFFYQHATLRMYTGNFKKRAAVCVILYCSKRTGPV